MGPRPLLKVIVRSVPYLSPFVLTHSQQHFQFNLRPLWHIVIASSSSEENKHHKLTAKFSSWKIQCVQKIPENTFDFNTSYRSEILLESGSQFRVWTILFSFITGRWTFWNGGHTTALNCRAVNCKLQTFMTLSELIATLNWRDRLVLNTTYSFVRFNRPLEPFSLTNSRMPLLETQNLS